MTGRLYAGTSGFAYPDWSPRFYPPGTRSSALLAYYASRLTTCELNNTYYQQPRPEKVEAWLAATSDGFRFAVKAQRGGSMRALTGDPVAAVPWLTDPLRRFGDRLATVLLRIPDGVPADIARLQALLAEWPPELPIVVEARHPSWRTDALTRLLAERAAVLCATDLPLEPEPTLRLTGSFVYLRLRRDDYEPARLGLWADRLSPFLEAGHDAFVFFRHDPVGHATELAEGLMTATAARLGEGAVARPRPPSTG